MSDLAGYQRSSEKFSEMIAGCPCDICPSKAFCRSACLRFNVYTDTPSSKERMIHFRRFQLSTESLQSH